MMELVVWWWWRCPMVLPWNGKLSHLATENQIWPDFVSLGFAFLYLSDWLVAKPNRFWKASYGSWICFLFSQKEIKYRNTFTLLMASLCGCEKGKFPFANGFVSHQGTKKYLTMVWIGVQFNMTNVLSTSRVKAGVATLIFLFLVNDLKNTTA